MKKNSKKFLLILTVLSFCCFVCLLVVYGIYTLRPMHNYPVEGAYIGINDLRITKVENSLETFTIASDSTKYELDFSIHNEVTYSTFYYNDKPYLLVSWGGSGSAEIRDFVIYDFSDYRNEIRSLAGGDKNTLYSYDSWVCSHPKYSNGFIYYQSASFDTDCGLIFLWLNWGFGSSSIKMDDFFEIERIENQI